MDGGQAPPVVGHSLAGAVAQHHEAASAAPSPLRLKGRDRHCRHPRHPPRAPPSSRAAGAPRVWASDGS